mgnify:CR=1 FL=1
MVNKVILVGNLGREPEVRYTPDGKAITNIALATSESWKDKNTGERKDKTEWHRVVFFGGLAAIAGEYLHKGSKVYLEGKLQTRKWQDQSGQDKYATEIIVDNFGGVMQMLDSKSGEQGVQSSNGQANHSPAPQSRPSQRTAPQPAPPNDDFDDDIPF